VPGRARTPGRHHRLGGPLPRQRPNTTTVRPTAPELWIAGDAPREHRWELPAVSRGYAQPWGWLPSPYSPLRHWPDPKTGPVRLACLIHAANVHSEPGSNPSQMSRTPVGPRDERGVHPAAGPHPKGLRKKNWSHDVLAMRVRPTTDSRITRESDSSVESSASPPMRNVCRSLRAIPTPVDLRTSGRAFPDDHSHAGFPQGFLTRRILTFVSLCLADECHQPNCQRARLAPLTSTDGIGRCRATLEQPIPAVSHRSLLARQEL
jgi:hypothetical protein